MNKANDCLVKGLFLHMHLSECLFLKNYSYEQAEAFAYRLRFCLNK